MAAHPLGHAQVERFDFERVVPSTIREEICVRSRPFDRRPSSPTTNEELMLRIIIWIASLITALSSAQAEEGTASRYGRSSGSKVACGGSLNEGAFTAAHRTLPCGSKVKVHNKSNGKSVTVTINDRGPFVRAFRAPGPGVGRNRGRLARVIT